MTVESDFFALMSGASGVTALVASRIYPDVLPEKTGFPAIVFARTKTDSIVGISGQVFGSDVDLSVGCWAETRTSADAVAAAIESAMTGSAFIRTGREAAFDPETGLFATIISATTFAA